MLSVLNIEKETTDILKIKTGVCVHIAKILLQRKVD